MTKSNQLRAEEIGTAIHTKFHGGDACAYGGKNCQWKARAIDHTASALDELEQEAWTKVDVVLSGFSREIRKVDLIEALEAARNKN